MPWVLYGLLRAVLSERGVLNEAVLANRRGRCRRGLLWRPGLMVRHGVIAVIKLRLHMPHGVRGIGDGEAKCSGPEYTGRPVAGERVDAVMRRMGRCSVRS